MESLGELIPFLIPILLLQLGLIVVALSLRVEKRAL